jgi:hypothetical protein
MFTLIDKICTFKLLSLTTKDVGLGDAMLEGAVLVEHDVVFFGLGLNLG